MKLTSALTSAIVSVGYSQQCLSLPHDSIVRVEVGSDLCINCPVQNADTWTIDGGNVPPEDILANFSLVVMDVSQDDGGMYLCRMGSDFADSFQVTVRINCKLTLVKK